jgi:hypothetical protein
MSDYIINIGGVNRPMTTTEIEEHKKLCASIPLPLDKKAQEKAQADKDAARQTVLDKLGLTEDEVAALLG